MAYARDADGGTTTRAAAAYDDDTGDVAPSGPSRWSRRRGRSRFIKKRLPRGPRAWTQPVSAQASAARKRAALRAERPRMPRLPTPEGRVSQWIPGRERARAARHGLAVPGTQAPELQLPVYLPNLDELKDMPLESLQPDQMSWWEKFYWGRETTPVDYRSMHLLGQLAFNAFWRWGSELFYEMPKVSERYSFAISKPLSGWKPSTEFHYQYNPFGSLVLAKLASFDPDSYAAEIVPEEVQEAVREYDWEDFKEGWIEGEIGYSLSAPGAYERFAQDVAAGMSVEDAIRAHEDVWTEILLNSIVDPSLILPSKAMYVLWPGGALFAKVAGRGAGELVSESPLGSLARATGWTLKNTIGKIPVARWLAQISTRTLQRQAVGAAVDSTTEVLMRLPGDEDLLLGLNRVLGGDTTGFDILSDGARVTMTGLVEEFQDDGIRRVEDLVERYVPSVAEHWGDEAFQRVLRERRGMLPYFIGEAVRARQAAELGITAYADRGIMARSLDFMGSLLKEQWLGPNPAYMCGNLTDNCIKALLTGHFINPFDLHADAKVTRYMAGYGSVLPQRVMEGFVADELGIDTLSRTAQIPIPGIGKPAEIVNFYNGLLGVDLRAIFPAVGGLAPERPSALARAFDLADSPGRMAGIADKMNWASLVEAGRGFSGQVERSARVQIFWQDFSKFMEGTARPRLVETATGLGLSDDLVRLLGDSSRTGSPLDILSLADDVAEFDPLVRLSSLMPEGGSSSEVLGQIGRELDRLQRLAVGEGAEAVERLGGQVDDLFQSAMAWADEVGHAATFERQLADWRADQLQAAVGDLLQRGRSVSDSLLLLTRDSISGHPELASSAWARYFDQKQAISRAVHEEASAIIRERLPGMTDQVDALLTRFEDVASSRPVGSLNPEDWGAFGMRLAELRGQVDDAFESTWQALARNPTEDGLSTVEAAYDAIYAHWEDVAGEASVWRDGWLTQDRRGTLSITAERYQQRMNEIWTEGFQQARQVWNDVAQALRPTALARPAEGTALYFVPRKATESQIEMGLQIMSMRSKLSIEELRRIFTDPATLDRAVLAALGEEGIMQSQKVRWDAIADDFFQAWVSPQGEMRATSVQGMAHRDVAQELWGISNDQFSQGAAVTWLGPQRGKDLAVRLGTSLTQEDALGVLRGLQAMGVPGDQQIVLGADAGGWMDRMMRGTLDEVMEEVNALIQRPLSEAAQDVAPAAAYVAQDVEIPAFPLEPAPADYSPAPTIQQLKSWLDAGTITQQQYDEYLEWSQRSAQMEFQRDAGTDMADRLGQQYAEVRGRLQEWYAAARAHVREATTSRQLAAEDIVSTQAQLRQLARQWAGDIEEGTIGAALEVRRTLFDYGVNQNWEEILRHFVPFHKWQLRNPIIWAQIISSKPWLAAKITQLIRASEQWREDLNLTGRFAGTMPVPEAISRHFPAPAAGGVWGMDPRALFSIAGQIREPFLSPQEEEMTGWRSVVGSAARAPEYLGMHPWPWIELPLEQTGAFGNRPPWGVLGTPGRVVPQLRRVEEQIAEARVPGSQWMMEYNVRRRIAELVAEGQATEQEAAEAQFNTEHPLYQRALQETRQVQDFMSAWRTMVPFGVKWASPGELSMREARGELAEMPPERSAFLRGQEPGLRAYGRAMTGVEAPEQGQWQAQRDAVFARYQGMMRDLAPWHPRYEELERSMWAEIDELGPAPEAYTERGYAVEGDRDSVLFALEQARPRAQDFQTADGQIDWDSYNAATAQYEAAVPEMAARWGVDLDLQEYKTFRQRYLSPLELAWEARQEEFEGAWDQYGELRGLQYPETTGEIAPGIQAGWLPGTAPGQVGLPSVEPMDIVAQAPEEMQPWVRGEVERRMEAGWGTGEIQAWLRGMGLPYEERQAEMERRGYGPLAVREMVPEVTRRRPWLATQGYGAREWGDIYPWLEKDMPGMFDAPTHADDLSSYYFDMMPAQRREMEQYLGLEEGTDIVQWAKDLPPEALRMTLMALESQMDNFRPPSGTERLAAERDMLRWSEGLGEWTDTMDQYFGDADSPKSQFWDYWFANKNYLSDEYQDDDVVQATLSKDVRGLLTADDFEDALYSAALERLQRYFQQDEADRWHRYPDLIDQAEEEREEFLASFGYGTKPEDDSPDEEAWWDARTAYLQDHPVHTWFYYYEKFIKWWGDVDPSTVGPYRPAPPPMPTPTPAPAPAPSKKKKGGGPDIPEPPTWP